MSEILIYFLKEKWSNEKIIT